MMNSYWSRMTPLPLSTLHLSRGSHIRVARRSVCDRDQNGIKRSTLFFGANQGIKRNSERLISTDQCTFLDTTEVWLRFVLWTPVKSSNQEPWNGAITRSRTIFTDRDSWSRSQMLLQATRMWLPLVHVTSFTWLVIWGLPISFCSSTSVYCSSNFCC